MQNLLLQRCFNHGMREAVARCPECGRFYCRECITEHDDRVLCSACLKKLARAPLAKRPAFVKVLRLAQCAAALVLAWFFFFIIGEMLLRIPTTFHDGALWHVNWMDQQ
jgi:hypothetical protein